MGNKPKFFVPGIPYIRMQFKLHSQGSGELPSFKGSLLRGVFGSALRKTVCVMGTQQLCQDCFLNRQCVNTRIFETLILDEPPRFLKGLSTSPRPFILFCCDERREFTADTPLEFEMSLFGNAIEFFPFVIFAVHTMAQRGLGSRRLKFHLLEATYRNKTGQWEKLYDGATRKLFANPAPLQTANHTYSPASNRATSTRRKNPSQEQLTVHFITPTRLKFNRELSVDFTFRQLLFKMLRRILELAYFYVPEADINWEFHDLLVAADEVEIIERELQWIDLTRYSSRQKTRMKLGGFVGHLTLQGNLTPFLPILHACEVLHIGKATTFGLGRVEVVEN